MSNALAGGSGFASKVASFLHEVDYSLVTSRADIEAVRRLRYAANLREGNIEPNAAGVLADRFDDMPNCYNVAVLVRGELCAALRMHLLCDSFPDSPLMHAYPDITPGKLASGARIIDITRLVADYDKARLHPYLPYATVRLSMLAATHFEADLILAAVRKEHLPFYRREFRAEPLTQPRPYPMLIKPLALFQIDLRAVGAEIVARHPFHASQASERERLFGCVHAHSLEDA
jgi:hypothetical protein